MAVTLSSRLCQPTALERQSRVTAIALALGAIDLGAGASPSLASTDSVYFDDNGNAAAAGIVLELWARAWRTPGSVKPPLTVWPRGSADTEIGLDAAAAPPPPAVTASLPAPGAPVEPGSGV